MTITLLAFNLFINGIHDVHASITATTFPYAPHPELYRTRV